MGKVESYGKERMWVCVRPMINGTQLNDKTEMGFVFEVNKNKIFGKRGGGGGLVVFGY